MSWSSSRIETVARWKQTEELNYSARRDGVLNEQLEKRVISRTLRIVKCVRAYVRRKGSWADRGRGKRDSFPGCTHTMMIQPGVQFKSQII